MIFFHVKLRSFTHNLLLKTFWHFHLKISYLIFSFFSFSFPSFKVHQKYQFFFFLCFHLPIVYNVCCCQMLNTTRLVISEISETETRNRSLTVPAQLSLTCWIITWTHSLILKEVIIGIKAKKFCPIARPGFFNVEVIYC